MPRQTDVEVEQAPPLVLSTHVTSENAEEFVVARARDRALYSTGAIREARNELQDRVARELRSALNGFVPDAIDQVAPRLEVAAEQYSQAVSRLAQGRITDTTLGDAGPDALTAPSEALKATRTLAAFPRFAASLSDLAAYGGETNRIWRINRPETADQY